MGSTESQEKEGKRESVWYTYSGRLSQARILSQQPLFQVSHLNYSLPSDSCACPELMEKLSRL